MAKVEDAVDFLRLSAEADSQNRAQGLEDLRFRYGDQWPVEVQNARNLEDRPALTINETDAYCRQITNAMRQQRPRIKAHPVDSGADVQVAKVITGITRHIEVNSDADDAYALAGEFQVTMGWGYWRLRTDYIREDRFEQDIFIDPVENPFTVYFDPNSSLPDGSDAERALITDKMRKTAFTRLYPGAQSEPFAATATGDVADWIGKDDIRIAEFFEIELIKAKLVALSDGSTAYEDELPTMDVLARAGISIRGDRPSWKRKCLWRKQTAFDILEEQVWPGRWIPIIPTYGVTLLLDGRRMRMGAVRFARDPQQMINYWKTTISESIAQAPRTKWLMLEGQDEGFENEWAGANTSALPYLRFKAKSINGEQFVPQRVQPEAAPQGALVAAAGASEDLRRVMGVFEPAARAGAQHKSDKTLRAERMQGEESNYHFYDNLTRSIKHTGRCILDLIPKVLDTQRVMRIIGDDGNPSVITVNEKKEIDGAQRVLNDITTGTYDVVMETGPGYNTRRQEFLDAFLKMLDGPLGEQIAKVGADLAVRTIDAPGMDVLADRLAAANPLAQIDETSEIPPKVQVMLKGLQMQLEEAQKALAAASIEQKFGIEKERTKQEGETRRTLITATGRAHETEVKRATNRHNAEVRAVTQQNVAEIHGLVQLLVKHIDTGQLERELAARNMEQELKAIEEEPLHQGHDEPVQLTP